MSDRTRKIVCALLLPVLVPVTLVASVLIGLGIGIEDRARRWRRDA